MKLIKITHLTAYTFTLFFENGENKEANLKELIAKYVNIEQIKTAQINSEWGCLEFNEGKVDIEPQTLYKFACNANNISAAA